MKFYQKQLHKDQERLNTAKNNLDIQRAVRNAMLSVGKYVEIKDRVKWEDGFAKLCYSLTTASFSPAVLSNTWNELGYYPFNKERILNQCKEWKNIRGEAIETVYNAIERLETEALELCCVPETILDECGVEDKSMEGRAKLRKDERSLSHMRAVIVTHKNFQERVAAKKQEEKERQQAVLRRQQERQDKKLQSEADKKEREAKAAEKKRKMEILNEKYDRAQEASWNPRRPIRKANGVGDQSCTICGVIRAELTKHGVAVGAELKWAFCKDCQLTLCGICTEKPQEALKAHRSWFGAHKPARPGQSVPMGNPSVIN
jgi:hypothetical protein